MQQIQQYTTVQLTPPNTADDSLADDSSVHVIATIQLPMPPYDSSTDKGATDDSAGNGSVADK